MKPRLHRMLIGLGASLVMVVAVTAIWRNPFAPAPIHRLLHRGIGERMADEAVQVVGTNGRLAVVTLESGANAILDAQVDAFCRRLAGWPGVRIVRNDRVDPAKSAKYGPGTGFSARRLKRLWDRGADVDAIVSFLGAPDPEEVAAPEGASRRPVLLVVSRSPKELAPLFRNGVLARAIVPRFVFPAPGPESPSTAEEWFENRFQVVTQAAAQASSGG